MQSSITLQASWANLNGGTTKQFEFDTNGRARHSASPPAIRCSICEGVDGGLRLEERGADVLQRAGAQA